MYVITGATGNTGGIITEKLLAKGEKVRVVGRDAKRLERFANKGAEPFVADEKDAAALSKAFSGAKAVYAMIPPNIVSPDVRAYQEQVSDDLAAAITKNGIKYAVVLSSVGSDKPDRTGPVVGLHSLEKKLDGIPGLNALCLASRLFYGEPSTAGRRDPVLRRDCWPSPAGFASADDRHSRRIGAVAAEALLNLDFTGKHSRELQGPRDVTYNDVAKIVGAAIGKPDLKYQQMPAAQLRPALLQMGMSSNMVDLLLEMAESLNSGYSKEMLEPRSPANSTPTTLDTFIAEVFVPAYKGIAAGA